MSFRCKRRWLHATLTACAVIVGVLAGTAQFASAFVACPSGGNRAGSIDEWDTLWGTSSETAKGVTLCEGVSGLFGANTVGYLQIVDLSDGAKIRLQTEVDESSEYGRFQYGESHSPNTLYRKRTADDWYSWIRSLTAPERINMYYRRPDPSRLFSVTNASFFKSEVNGEPTKVSFPVKNWSLQNSFGVSQEREESISDRDAEKTGLVIGSGFRLFGEEGTQTIKVEYFPRNYTETDYWEYLLNRGWGLDREQEVADAIVSFPPGTVVGKAEDNYEKRRNYVGVYDNKVYMFLSDDDMLNSTAWGILREIQPGIDVIQLDGGGSAQFYSAYGEMDSSIPIFNREVPNVLAVYRAP
jgi:hypothetical protein